MNRFEEDFLDYAGFGPAIQSKAVPADKIARFRGKLPDKLLEYWQTYGWCGYAKGLFWTVDPDEWEPVLEAWIGDTPFMEQDEYYVIARNAFGELYLWGRESGASLKIRPCYAQLYPNDDREGILKHGADRRLETFFRIRKKSRMDFEDVNDEPLFERALSTLGSLDHSSIYGFVPALALGGLPKLENLQKVSAVEHLIILAGLTEREIMMDIGKLAKM